jgi:hypothetical protein
MTVVIPPEALRVEAMWELLEAIDELDGDVFNWSAVQRCSSSLHLVYAKHEVNALSAAAGELKKRGSHHGRLQVHRICWTAQVVVWNAY